MFITFQQLESLADALLDEGHPEILRVFHYGLPEDYDDPPDADGEIAAHHAWITRHHDDTHSLWRVSQDLVTYVFEAERSVETDFHDAHPESDTLYVAFLEAETPDAFTPPDTLITDLSRDLASLSDPHSAPMRVLLAAVTGGTDDALTAATDWAETFADTHSGLQSQTALLLLTRAIQGDLLLAIDIEDPYS